MVTAVVIIINVIFLELFTGKKKTLKNNKIN